MSLCKECGYMLELGHHSNCKYSKEKHQMITNEEETQLGGSCLFCGVQHGEKHKGNCNMLTPEEVGKICLPRHHIYYCLSCGSTTDGYHYPTCPTQYTVESKYKISESTEGTALQEQIGGNHYKNFTIQPLEFITKNKLSFIQGCVIKRVCRYNLPGGKGKEDLLKIIHELQCLIEMEY
jgi:hypothetical protein